MAKTTELLVFRQNAGMDGQGRRASVNHTTDFFCPVERAAVDNLSFP